MRRRFRVSLSWRVLLGCDSSLFRFHTFSDGGDPEAVTATRDEAACAEGIASPRRASVVTSTPDLSTAGDEGDDEEEDDDGGGGGPVAMKSVPAPSTNPTAAAVTATSIHSIPLLVCQKPPSFCVTRSKSQGRAREAFQTSGSTVRRWKGDTTGKRVSASKGRRQVMRRSVVAGGKARVYGDDGCLTA